MTNKALGWLVLVSIGLCIVAVSLTAADSGLQTLGGLGVLVFGIWAGIRLISFPRPYGSRGPQDAWTKEGQETTGAAMPDDHRRAE